MESNLILFTVVTVITATGAALQGSVGLGLGFVAVPLLALVNSDYLPGPLLLAALFLTILISSREYKFIQFKSIKWVLSGRLIGSTFGVFLLLLVPKDHLSVLFAVMIIFGVVMSISGYRLELNNRNLVGTGTISGLMATTSAIGGPPLAMIFQYLKGPELRGTLSGIFVFGTIISLILLSIINRFGLYEVILSLTLLPGIFVGFVLSKYTSKILDRGFIRPAVLIFSLVSGIFLILNSIY